MICITHIYYHFALYYVCYFNVPQLQSKHIRSHNIMLDENYASDVVKTLTIFVNPVGWNFQTIIHRDDNLP